MEYTIFIVTSAWFPNKLLVPIILVITKNHLLLIRNSRLQHKRKGAILKRRLFKERTSQHVSTTEGLLHQLYQRGLLVG